MDEQPAIFAVVMQDDVNSDEGTPLVVEERREFMVIDGCTVELGDRASMSVSLREGGGGGQER